MKKTITAIAVATAFGLCTTAAHAQYDLIYNADTGNLTIDTKGGPLYAYIIQGPGDLSIEDGFEEQDYTPIPITVDNGSALTASDDELSQSNFSGWLSLPPTNLGSVLEPDLDPIELNDVLRTRVYVDNLGELGQPENFYEFNVVYVPEPTTLGILGLGGLALLGRRRPHRAA